MGQSILKEDTSLFQAKYLLPFFSEIMPFYLDIPKGSFPRMETQSRQTYGTLCTQSFIFIVYFSISLMSIKGKPVLEQQALHYPQVHLYLDYGILRQATVLSGNIELPKIGDV